MMRNVIHAAALAAAILTLAPADAAAQAHLRPAPTQPDWSWKPTPPPPPPAPTFADPRPANGGGGWVADGPAPADPWAPDAYGTHAGAARPDTFSRGELIDAGHAFFGETSSGFAEAIEGLLGRFGSPNGYILGEEGAGAVFGGLRYGDGKLTTAGSGETPIYWQGPSVGWDFGGSGSRVMMLVYDLPEPGAMLQRFTGVDGSAYMVGGASVTVMAANSTYLIPVRTGVGARLGVSIGYLKFTDRPTWNPF